LPKLDGSTIPKYQFWGILITLSMLFLMGGSSRADVQSLAILDPAMVLCCGAALLTLKQQHWNGKRWLVFALMIVFLLVAFYLLPTPRQFENISRGVSDLATINAAANVTGASQLLAAAPTAAWQSLFFLFAPLAVFLFAIQLERRDFLLTLPLIIFAATISGVIGMLQIIGSADGPLYLYRITNNGAAVGLFANRNHAAVLLACLIPMLAVFAAGSSATKRGGRNTRQLISIAIAVILVPLILVTGSRSGMLAAIIGLVGGLLLYNSSVSIYSRSKTGRPLAAILMASLLFCLVFATIYFSRAEAIKRIFAENSSANDRADFWASSLQLFWQYFPFGFGPGSFVPAFQKEEPLFLLNSAYLNRLHNDWLETVLTFGVPGILILICGLAYYMRRSFILWVRMDGARSTVATGRMASVVIAILGIASVSDYPLRTPTMMGVAALVLCWFIEARDDPEDATNNRKHASPLIAMADVSGR
jgi:O-antigen ligase